MPVFPSLPAEVLREIDPQPLDPDNRHRGNAAVSALLRELQGNQLKGHGRDFAVLSLVRFDPTRPDEIRSYLAGLESQITWAEVQQEQSKMFKAAVARLRAEERADKSLFALSDKALVRRWSERVAEKAFVEARENEGSVRAAAQPGAAPFVSVLLTYQVYVDAGIGEIPEDDYFRAGMAASAAGTLRDQMSKWEDHYLKSQPWHALILVAADDARVAEATATALRDRAPDKLIEQHFEEEAAQLYRKGLRVEPFGFADGLSGPVFLQADYDKARAGQAALPWDPRYPLTRLLHVAEPGSQLCGSFVVLRKLEQNVQNFADTMSAQGTAYGGEEMLGAMVVGRFADGTPLASEAAPRRPNPADEGELARLNHFSYPAIDPDGAGRCPFGAHVRRSNPRGVIEKEDERQRERKIVVARRGLPYDDRELERTSWEWRSDDRPAQKTGLLFLACVGSIKEQFVPMQENWLNMAFPAQPAGIDALSGQLARATGQRRCFPTNGPALNLPEFVQTKGGEYFFAPPRALFTALATGKV